MMDTDKGVEEEDSLSSQEQFFKSIKDGNISEFMELLKQKVELGLDLEGKDSNGDTVLKLAIKQGYSVLVQQLLKHNIQVSDALLKSVDVGFAATVKVICEYALNLPTREKRLDVIECHCEDEEFHPDVTPIILAAQRNDFTMVKILLEAGASIPEDFKGISTRATDSLQKSTGLLEVWKGLASEAYVSLKYIDPVDKAFVLSQRLEKLSKTEIAFKSSYLELTETVNQIGPEIVSCARSTEEILTVLTHHDGNDGENMHMGPLPKLSRAIQFDQRHFVAEPNCQQAVKSKFYGVLSSMRDSGAMSRLFFLLSMIVMFPLLALSYLYIPTQYVRSRLECPYVKFVMHLASDLYFITLITTDVMIHEDITSTLSLTRPTRGLLLLWIIGIGWQVISALRNDQHISINRSKHMRNTILVATFLIGVVLDLASYYSYTVRESGTVSLQVTQPPISISPASNVAYNEALSRIQRSMDSQQPFLSNNGSSDFNVTEFLLHNGSFHSKVTKLRRVPIMPSYRRAQVSRGSGSDSSDSVEPGEFVYSEDVTLFLNLVWWHPRLFATAMFSIATVIAFLRMLPYVAVSDTLGPLQISLWSMINKTLHFFLVMGIVILAIAVGLTYIYAYYTATEYQLCVFLEGEDNCTRGPLANLLLVNIYLYWSLFGLEDSKRLELDNVEQTFLLQKVGFMLYALFFIFAAVVLLNALIAVMTEVYNDIEGNADTEWKFASTSMYLTFMQAGNVVPPPFNLLPSSDDFIRLLKFTKKELRPRRKPPPRNSIRRQRLKNEGVKLRSRRSSTAAIPKMSQYQRVISRLVERYISTKATDELDAESDVNISDIRELRNDLLSLKFEIFQKIHASVEDIHNAVGKGSRTVTKSRDTNAVFRHTDIIHSIVRGHLKDVRKFTKELEATIAAIPDPPETTETDAQTSVSGINFDDLSGPDGVDGGVEEVQLATTGSQTSSQWMNSKKIQTMPPGMNETSMQTTRDFVTDNQSQTIKPPKILMIDESTQISRFFEGAIPNGTIGHRGHPAKSKYKLLSCLYPGLAVQYDAHQMASEKPKMSDFAAQTTTESRLDSGQQTSVCDLVNTVLRSEEVLLQSSPKEDLVDSSSQTQQTGISSLIDGTSQTAVLKINEEASQTSRDYFSDVLIQTSMSEHMKEISSQTIDTIHCDARVQTHINSFIDKASQTPIVEAREEVSQTGAEYLSDTSSQTPTPLPKDASLQTINAVLSDGQVQAAPDMQETKIQTCREELTETFSQTISPDMTETYAQTTKLELSDSVAQAVVAHDEISMQTSRDYVVDIDTQTQTDIDDATSQTDVVISAIGVTQTPAPPDVNEIFVQTTREHVLDGYVQTEPTLLENIASQTDAEVILDTSTDDYDMSDICNIELVSNVDTGNRKSRRARSLGAAIASKVRFFDTSDTRAGLEIFASSVQKTDACTQTEMKGTTRIGDARDNKPKWRF